MGRNSNFKGWVTVGDKTCYFKSYYEVYYARYLQLLKDSNRIIDWEYETETFYFEGIKRGTNNTKLDFKILIQKGDAVEEQYIEVKGDWDNKSVTRVKRFRKYYPQHKLVIIDNARRQNAQGIWELGFFDKLKKTLGSNHPIFSAPQIVENPNKKNDNGNQT